MTDMDFLLHFLRFGNRIELFLEVLLSSCGANMRAELAAQVGNEDEPGRKKGEVSTGTPLCVLVSLFIYLFYPASQQTSLVSGLEVAAAALKAAAVPDRKDVLAKKLGELGSLLPPVFRLPLGPEFEVTGFSLEGCGFFSSKSLPLRLSFRNSMAVAPDIRVIFKAGEQQGSSPVDKREEKKRKDEKKRGKEE
jgi:hypothetical protein